MSHPAPLTLLRALGLALSGRVHFPKTLVGQIATRRDGKQFTVFRQAVVAPGPAPAGEKAAVLCFRFRFASGTPGFNKRASLIPMPLIVGYPGFRTKIWCLEEESGGFIGVYEFARVEDAEGYANSLAIKLMKKRAAPGTVEQDIFRETTVAVELERFGVSVFPHTDAARPAGTLPECGQAPADCFRSGASRFGP